jgi:hypothetical protein
VSRWRDSSRTPPPADWPVLWRVTAPGRNHRLGRTAITHCRARLDLGSSASGAHDRPTCEDKAGPYRPCRGVARNSHEQAPIWADRRALDTNWSCASHQRPQWLSTCASSDSASKILSATIFANWIAWPMNRAQGLHETMNRAAVRQIAPAVIRVRLRSSAPVVLIAFAWWARELGHLRTR